MPPNPLARPFPYPPSPTPTDSTSSSYIRPDSNSSNSYPNPWQPGSPLTSTSRSNSLSSLSSSTSFPKSSPVHVNLPAPGPSEAFDFGAIGQAKRVRQFGEGWKSTLTGINTNNGQANPFDDQIDTPRTPPMTGSFLDDASATTPVAPRFQDAHHHHHQSANQGILHHDITHYAPDPLETFNNLRLYSNNSRAPDTPSHSLDPFSSPYLPQFQQAPVDPRFAPRLTPRVPALIHHQSVPNLDRQQRRQGNVRFSDELVAYDEEQENTPPRLRMGPKSLSNLAVDTRKRNVYIHCVPPQITESALRVYAETYGKVLSMRVAVDEGKGMDRFENRRHAFVMFETNEQAGGFMGAIRSKGLPCEYAKEDWQTEYKAREDRTSSNIYVVGLPLEWGKDEVDDYMTQFGRVASLRLLEDKDGNRRGPVLIRFDSRPQAERAIKLLNGQTHPGTGERLQARIADSDGQKDYKKLRTSTSSDLLLDDRESPAGDEAEDVEYLLTIRDKYARRLQLLNAQITAASEQHTPPPSAPFQLNPFGTPFQSRSHIDLPTPPNSALDSPQPWRHRQLSTTGSNAYSPWGDVSPNYPSGYSFAPYALDQQAEAGQGYQQRSGYSHHQQSGLRQARSTPELREESPAKLFWPN